MLTIKISDIELYDNSIEEFVNAEGGVFKFEHSLEAISKWESIWKLPFLNTDLSLEQQLSYFECMCLDENLTRTHLTPEVVNKLEVYINDEHTATTVSQNDNNTSSGKTITTEVIYGMMVNAGIPFECARWPFSRLQTLLSVIAATREEPKKMSKQEILEQNASLNEQRKREMNTKG